MFPSHVPHIVPYPARPLAGFPFASSGIKAPSRLSTQPAGNDRATYLLSVALQSRESHAKSRPVGLLENGGDGRRASRRSRPECGNDWRGEVHRSEPACWPIGEARWAASANAMQLRLVKPTPYPIEMGPTSLRGVVSPYAPSINIPDRARTCNLRLRRPTLYPIGLRGRDCNFYRCKHLCRGKSGWAETTGGRPQPARLISPAPSAPNSAIIAGFLVGA